MEDNRDGTRAATTRVFAGGLGLAGATLLAACGGGGGTATSASWFQVYWRVIMPLSTPALGVVAIYNFTAHWNDFLKPLIYLNRANMFTLPLGLGLPNGRYGGEMQQIMAQTALSIIPVLLIVFLTQRNYVQGVVVSGVKG
jgi:ABC-type glycerol-3-phosphate transport system permease component